MAVLDISDLKKSYVSPEGETQVVIDIPQFSLAEKQQVALQGSSGSGKTTFLNLIAGILDADQGQITLSGKEIVSLSETERDLWRASHLGYVFQTFNLLQGYTALENVSLGMLFGPGIDQSYALHLLERVGLKDRLHYRPSQLSIGQQQRVAVARALANRPHLVLADEPTGNLDHRHAQDALDLIRSLCRENNAALLLVSHDQAILKQFDDRRDLSEINRAAADYQEEKAKQEKVEEAPQVETDSQSEESKPTTETRPPHSISEEEASESKEDLKEESPESSEPEKSEEEGKE